MRISSSGGRSYALAANISLLFTEVDLLDRPAAAAAAGFEAVESWWPFNGPAPAASDVDAFVSAVEDAGVALTGMNLYAGDMPSGERGVLSDPSRVDEFATALRVAADVAGRTGCAGFNALYGQRIAGMDPDAQDRTATANLTRAVRVLGDLGGVVLIEPLSRGLNGAYPLESAADALAVVHRVREASGRDAIAFLFDTFHLANNGEDLSEVIRRYVVDIGHVQLADAPGRGEPGSGTIDFEAVLDGLSEAGYTGTVALEYAPTSTTETSLAMLSTVNPAMPR
ncbi:hydroxypyruvate isomerase family protein [Leifsonia sp. NPDC058230]|uniref:hydroxypyruvate isomerase family protein n=1 Tax=Leifsonia sp. NPDC058230 TaxID=3346391 RepID=UPI0036DA9247